jgi:hypothetical protein
MDAPVLDAALSAMPVYRAGVRFDGIPVLSHEAGAPGDDTVVWFLDAPDRKMTVLDAEDMTDVSWYAEPDEFVPPRTAAAMPTEPDEYDEDAPEDPEVDPDAADDGEDEDDEEEVEALSEAELDELGEAIEAAETRVAQLEGLVASVILAGVTDAIFVDEPKQASVTLQVPDLAALTEGLSGMSELGERMAVIAALEPGDLPPDLAERVQAVTDRLDALEGDVAKLMLDDVTDEELPAREDDSTFVDETNPNRTGHSDDLDDDDDDSKKKKGRG